jgi:formylglycine-generating enzyme required for sulfatase activity
VINVSWEDAKAYVEWLSTEIGQPYRLLSEAEWEYTCRAGSITLFWWGDQITPADANYGALVGKTSEVDRYAPNPWGLYNMHGNVSEWVEDRWHDSYVGAPDDGSAWIEGSESRRVRRGGSWACIPGFLRSAFRIGSATDDRSDDVGFRAARTLSPSESVTS